MKNSLAIAAVRVAAAVGLFDAWMRRGIGEPASLYSQENKAV